MQAIKKQVAVYGQMVMYIANSTAMFWMQIADVFNTAPDWYTKTPVYDTQQ